MIDIWAELEGQEYITSMMATIHRVTDDQQLIATMSLVNNVEEQGILEDLLEETKPQKPEGFEDLDYFLITPFRYPPLKYGSRFGSTFEPSLFYGSLNISTALSETAYYRFVFLSGMQEPYEEPLQVTYSSYTVAIRTNRGIFLDKEPFDKYEADLTSSTNYTTSQRLGSSMRESKVEAFQYVSARDPKKGSNVALFTPRSFQSKKPINLERWLCQVTVDEVGFISNDNHRRFSFAKEIFEVDGEIPSPAC